MSFNLAHAAMVSLELFGLNGQRVAGIADGHYAAGRHAVPLRADGLPAGLTAGSSRAAVPVVLLK